MKRNMDLIRNLLLKLEEMPYEYGGVDINIEGSTDNEITYHVLLLHEAGLIDAIDVSRGSIIQYKPRRLTWEGHEFLEAVRDDARWRKVKNAMKKIGGFVYAIAKPMAIEFMKGQIT